MEKKNIILDLDTGIDDAVALTFAGHLKNINLELITTVFGNVELNQVIKNTLVILEDINRQDIPVFKGERTPLEINNFNISAHGKNGLGNYTHTTKIKCSKKNYLKAMHEVISKNSMTYIVACGPLTNLAKFIQTYPEDNDKVTAVIVTGLLDIDKENPYLNFNIQKDIKACEIVLNSYKNLVIVPSDMGHIAYIAQKDFPKTAKTGRVGKILANFYPYHLDRTVKDGAAMHDLCGILWLSNPEIFTTVNCNTKIKHTKKGSYLDINYQCKKTNAKIATEINTKQMKKIYYKTLKGIN